MNQFPQDVLKDIRIHLEEEHARIKGRMDELAVQDPFTDSDRVNDNAASDLEASEESSHDRVAALISELKIQSELIEKALERIKNKTYGFCQVCGEMIDTDRLGIIPTATLCMVHEKEHQAKSRTSS